MTYKLCDPLLPDFQKNENMGNEQEYECPRCGELADFLYVDKDEEDKVLGCPSCVRMICAVDYFDDGD